MSLFNDPYLPTSDCRARLGPSQSVVAGMNLLVFDARRTGGGSLLRPQGDGALLVRRAHWSTPLDHYLEWLERFCRQQGRRPRMLLAAEGNGRLALSGRIDLQSVLVEARTGRLTWMATPSLEMLGRDPRVSLEFHDALRTASASLHITSLRDANRSSACDDQLERRQLELLAAFACSSPTDARRPGRSRRTANDKIARALRSAEALAALHETERTALAARFTKKQL